jgi:hypothetical protein
LTEAGGKRSRLPRRHIWFKVPLKRRHAAAYQDHLGNALGADIGRQYHLVGAGLQQLALGARQFAAARWSEWRSSDPIASLPDEKNENGDQHNHDKHPVLTLETQKCKMLNEKLQAPPLFPVQDKRFVCAG